MCRWVMQKERQKREEVSAPLDFFLHSESLHGRGSEVIDNLTKWVLYPLVSLGFIMPISVVYAKGAFSQKEVRADNGYLERAEEGEKR
jgi:hypothetical protein